MRNLLLTSTAAVCLLLAGQVANAQSDQKKDEVKKEQVQRQEQRREQQIQQQQQKREQQAEEKKNEPNKADAKTSEPNKDAASSSDKKDQNAATKPSSDTNKSAESEKSKREENRKSAAEQKQNASPSKSTASDQNKANELSKPSTAAAPKSATQKQENASTPSSNTNATNDSTKKSTTNTANQAQPNAKTNAAQLDPQKKVRISESLSKQRNLAPPVRNLSVSITVGQRVPRRIHLHSLPRTIVTIAPEYRGYDYFTTEEDIVIVSPRTHEIVTRIPRDASRARAEAGGSSTTITSSSGGSGGGSMPCQVMQRSASGDMKPVDSAQLRQTTGSGGNSDRLAVKVQAPNGQQMPEVTLPDREGRIVAETDGSGCRIIVEPGRTGR